MTNITLKNKTIKQKLNKMTEKDKTFDLLKRYDQIKVEMKEADATNRMVLEVEAKAIKDKLIELSPMLAKMLEK